MMKAKISLFTLVSLLFFAFNDVNVAHAAANTSLMDGVDLSIDGSSTSPVKMLVFVALLSLAPSMLIMFSPFTYVIIVLGMTRQALGTMNLPPNRVLIGLALFISAYMMFPVLNTVYDEVWVPLEEENMTVVEALKIAEEPVKEYVLDNTYEKDLSLMMKVRGDEKPGSYDDVSILAAVPAFTLTQIQKGLFTGMMIYWAFAFIDMMISSLLMYMGMMMLPPMILSLPFKVLIFIYIGGYNTIVDILFKSVKLAT